MTLENPDQDSESIRNQRNSDDHKGYPDQQINTEAAKFEAPPPNANPHQSCKHKKRWLDYGTFAVEVLGIVGLGIYCSLTLGIYYAGKNSIEIATKTLQENKRQFNDTLVQMKLLLKCSLLNLPPTQFKRPKSKCCWTSVHGLDSPTSPRNIAQVTSWPGR